MHDVKSHRAYVPTCESAGCNGLHCCHRGVAILEALDIVAKTAGNKTIENAIYKVRTGIAEGQTIADPLSETGVFPPMVCSMIENNSTGQSVFG